MSGLFDDPPGWGHVPSWPQFRQEPPYRVINDPPGAFGLPGVSAGPAHAPQMPVDWNPNAHSQARLHAAFARAVPPPGWAHRQPVPPQRAGVGEQPFGPPLPPYSPSPVNYLGAYPRRRSF